MFRNYLKIAVRSLLKQKLYSGINIFGLALGMACALLIGLWVRDEMSYDRFLPDAKSIYCVRVNYPDNGEILTDILTPNPLQEAIAKDVPEVAAVTKLYHQQEYLIRAGDKATKEKGYYATPGFFNVFTLPVISGDPKTALAQPDKIVITRKLSETYFPDGLALGKTLQLNNDRFYTVGAVIDDLPANTNVPFDWLVNLRVIEKPSMKTSWGNDNYKTFVRLRPNATLKQAETAMNGLYPRYADEGNESAIPILQPITDLHLYGEYKNGKPAGGRIEYVRIFSIVALFILLIACINFMNLATARSAMRAKEVGVRKVVGALRSSLIGQFLSESMLTSLLATLLALVLVWAVLPTFSTVFDKQLALDFTEVNLWLIIGLMVSVTGVVSGSYPAFFMSGLLPAHILKGVMRSGRGPKQFRRVLVVFQFALSIFLIVGMVVVGRQMNYLRTKNIGLDREHVVYIPLEGELIDAKRTEIVQQEISQQPSIVSTTLATHLPVDVNSNSTDLTWPGKDPQQPAKVSAMSIGRDFIRTMNIKLLDGRDFRADSPADSSNYLVNETAAKLMGMRDRKAGSPVGNEITFWQGKGRIVGLMKDFHLGSMHRAITPLVLSFNPADTRYLLIKTRAGQAQQAIADLEKLTKQFNPNYPFTYHFLDEEYERLYRSEQQVNTLVNYFGLLAILISCLGLFGLAAFTAEQRTKEIGVRKVLGASVASIVTLLSKDFLTLVLIALVLATPVAWWAVSEWLGTFAYSTPLSWWVFALAGLLAVGIALLTVSFQSIRAALMNPVNSLRSE